MKTYVLKSNNGSFVAPNNKLSGINLTTDINEAEVFEYANDNPELKELTYNSLAKLYIDSRTKFKAVSL
jgi:hypothetical protein